MITGTVLWVRWTCELNFSRRQQSGAISSIGKPTKVDCNTVAVTCCKIKFGFALGQAVVLFKYYNLCCIKVEVNSIFITNVVADSLPSYANFSFASYARVDISVCIIEMKLLACCAA
jgi:hypothetical protein